MGQKNVTDADRRSGACVPSTERQRVFLGYICVALFCGFDSFVERDGEEFGDTV